MGLEAHRLAPIFLSTGSGFPGGFMLLTITIDTRRNLQQEEIPMAAEHQRLIDAWRELWSQYKAIIDAFDGLIYICSQSYEIEFVNRHLAEMLGYSPLGQKCYKAFYNLDHPCPRCSKEKVRRGETIRQKSCNPQNNRTYYQVATPFYLKGEGLMMVTIQYLPGNCLTQMISMDSGKASVEVLGRDVA
jgi:PAS domain-containing protein